MNFHIKGTCYCSFTIKISYYEQKTFWSFCAYMVRSRKGIEMLVNLINISYCAMKILPVRARPWRANKEKHLRDFSPRCLCAYCHLLDSFLIWNAEVVQTCLKLILRG